jgi:hypothetical protein
MKPPVEIYNLHRQFSLLNRQCNCRLPWRLIYINRHCKILLILVVFYVSNISSTYTPSSCSDHQHLQPTPSIGGELRDPKTEKYKGEGFAPHFFGGGDLRRLVSASHSASHF